MLKRLSTFFYFISKGWVAVCAIILFVGFMIFVLPAQAEKAKAYGKEAGSPDQSFFYSREDLFRMAKSYGEEGRAAYIHARFTFDAIFPLVYLFFLGTSISWSLSRTTAPDDEKRLLNLFPVLGTVFDYLENIAASIVMWNYPTQTSGVDWLAPIFTSVKWFFVGGSFVILAVVFCLAIFKRKPQ